MSFDTTAVLFSAVEVGDDESQPMKNETMTIISKAVEGLSIINNFHIGEMKKAILLLTLMRSESFVEKKIAPTANGEAELY